MNYYLSFMYPLSLLVGVFVGGYASFLTPGFAFLLLPVFDQLTGIADAQSGRRRRNPDTPLIVYCALQPVLIFLVLNHIHHTTPDLIEVTGLLLSLAVCTGLVGTCAGHELLHRKGSLRILAKVQLGSILNLQYVVNHIKNHHYYGGTSMDHSTPAYKENFYGFLLRSLAGGLRASWAYEKYRMAKRGYALFGYQNMMMHAFAAMVILPVSVWLIFDSATLIFFLLHCLGAQILGEMMNYVEHYGLMREKTPYKRYVNFDKNHAWNGRFAMSNWSLFERPRHSHHHMHPEKPFHRLRTDPKSPQMPFGYTTMLMLALIPPLWFLVMDPLVQRISRNLPQDHREKKAGKGNPQAPADPEKPGRKAE